MNKPSTSVSFLPRLESTIKKLASEFTKIEETRKATLLDLTKYIRGNLMRSENVKLIFICTHNSRRSHMAQLWAKAAAAFYGIENTESYSGGTEATAFNPKAVKAMKEAGFEITQPADDENPKYQVQLAENLPPVTAFSKKYDDAFNPQQNFGAVMTCSHADENCPVVVGADVRIPLPYDDPKDFDGTALEESKYRERVEQIGRELLYVFSQVKL